MFSSQNSQVSSDANYIEDVFSTYLYTGVGGNSTITNSIDLSTKGGLVWIKDRSNAEAHILNDTNRGANNILQTQATDPSYSVTNFLNSFNTTGFTVGTNCNTSAHTYASWTFRKQPKFFDVVTYTGNGVAGTQIPHSLGSTPGCIIVKRYAGPGGPVDWAVWHNQLGGSEYLKLNTNDAGITNAAYPPFGAVTSTYFTVGNASATGNNGLTNSNGDSFVAYVFAHNAGGFGLTGTDNVISCGFFYDGGGVVNVNLGYEPQWILYKPISSAGSWLMWDTMRGMSYSMSEYLRANTSDAAGSYSSPYAPYPTATGFTIPSGVLGGGGYIYIAIRRGPMKVPTSGTSVFSPNTANSASSPYTVTTNFPVDLTISSNRAGSDKNVNDRLRGGTATYFNTLFTNTTGAESISSGSNGLSFQSNTALIDNGYWAGYGLNVIYWNMRRAPSFFDEVCYTGNSTSGATQTHNLGVVPELMIVKGRSVNANWFVYSQTLGATKYLILNDTGGSGTLSSVWNDTAPTSTTFTLGNAGAVNASGGTYVAYLFATCAGVSKVGNYTGNGTTQTINCGFTGGARFVLIKRTDSTGDWYVYDTARGIVSANDPHLSLNTTAAEVTTDDTIDTDSTGFIVNQVTATNVNVSSATYIYLAIA